MLTFSKTTKCAILSICWECHKALLCHSSGDWPTHRHALPSTLPMLLQDPGRSKVVLAELSKRRSLEGHWKVEKVGAGGILE